MNPKGVIKALIERRKRGAMDQAAFRLGRLVGVIEERLRSANLTLGEIYSVKQEIDKGVDPELAGAALDRLEQLCGMQEGAGDQQGPKR